MKGQTPMGELRWDATQIVLKWGNLFLKVKASCLLKMKIYLFLWHLIRDCFPFLQLSSHHLLPICTTCTKANMHSQPKKTPNLEYLYSYSPSVHLSCCSCCDPVLFCFSHSMGFHPKLPLQAHTWCHISCRWVVSEKTQ